MRFLLPKVIGTLQTMEINFNLLLKMVGYKERTHVFTMDRKCAFVSGIPLKFSYHGFIPDNALAAPIETTERAAREHELLSKAMTLVVFR